MVKVFTEEHNILNFIQEHGKITKNQEKDSNITITTHIIKADLKIIKEMDQVNFMLNKNKLILVTGLIIYLMGMVF